MQLLRSRPLSIRHQAVWLAIGAGLFAPMAGAATGPVTGFIVQLRDEAAPAQRMQRLQAIAGERGMVLRAGPALTGRWQRLEIGDAARTLGADEAEAWAAQLRADPRISAVVPDVREQRLDVVPNDARFASQWWLQAVAAGNTGVAGFSSAWTVSTGAPVSGPGAVVAVLDSGITSHPELNARLLPGHDFVTDGLYANDGDGRDADPADPGDAITAGDRTASPAAFGGCPDAPLSSWHGTVIAGQVAAVTGNREGVAAGNWHGRVLPVRVAGKCGAAVADIIDGLRWAAGLPVAGVADNPNPARLIVLSYGSVETCDVASSSPSIAATAQLYTEALAEVRRAGALVIVAAGNQRSGVGRPASCAGAFGVASLNREGFKATYSNLGSRIALATAGGDAASGGTCDGQLADGGIVSTGNLGDITPGAPGYVAATGTSFAAPAVAAVASLMLAVDPTLGPDALEQGLTRSARPHVQVPLLGACAIGSNAGRCGCTADTCGAGTLDAVEALAYAAAPASYVAPARNALSLDNERIRACAVLLGRLPPEDGPPAASESGGGAVSAWWLLGLAVAVAGLRRRWPRIDAAR